MGYWLVDDILKALSTKGPYLDGGLWQVLNVCVIDLGLDLMPTCSLTALSLVTFGIIY